MTPEPLDEIEQEQEASPLPPALLLPALVVGAVLVGIIVSLAVGNAINCGCF